MTPRQRLGILANTALIRRALVVSTAVAMVLVTAVPVGTWRHASTGTVYRGFDRNLLSVNELNDETHNPGRVHVSADAVQISTVPDSLPSVHLLTTSSRSFRAGMKVLVRTDLAGTTPLRLGLWNPRSDAGYFLVFGPAPDDAISTEAVVGGIPVQTLVGGTVDRVVRGRYLPGQTYTFGLTVDKAKGLITYDLAGPGLESPIRTKATPSTPPGLLTELKLTLTASAASTSGISSSTLEDYSLSVLPESGGAVRVDDPHATALLILLGIIGATLLAIAGVATARRLKIDPPKPASWWRRKPLRVVGGAVLAVLIANAILFGLGTAPFDMADQRTWSYIAAAYSPIQVYLLAPFISVARAWNGVPYSEAVFPYQPVMVYLFTLFGWISRLFGSFQIDYLVKAVNVAFGLVDGFLIFSILRRLHVSPRWSIVAAALFVFNPAVWFSMSIWGANHVLSLFFVLLAILLLEHDHPIGAWLALGVGSLTRPQMLVLGVLVGVVLLRRFSLWRNAYAMSWVVIVIFLLMIPFTIAISPSLPVDLVANTVQVQALGGNEKALTTVSLDAYSFWPLVDFYIGEQSGLGRIFYPSDSSLIGTLTYHQAGLLATIAILIGAIGMLASRSRTSLIAGGYIPLVAFGVSGFLIFTTGLAATHFILVLPFILLSRPWLSPAAYYSIVAGWTITTLIAMYGILAIDLANSDFLHAPLFGQNAPLRSVTSFVAQLYTSDRTISVGAVTNTLIFVGLMLAAVRNQYRTA